MSQELIARIEAATGPDRELDKAIYAALGNCNHERTKYYFIEDGNDVDSGHTCLDCGKDTYGAKSALLYTKIIDAALTLVPDWPVRQMHFNAPDADVRKWNVQLRGGKEGEKWVSAFAATPASALCAAALKARTA